MADVSERWLVYLQRCAPRCAHAKPAIPLNNCVLPQSRQPDQPPAQPEIYSLQATYTIRQRQCLMMKEKLSRSSLSFQGSTVGSYFFFFLSHMARIYICGGWCCAVLLCTRGEGKGGGPEKWVGLRHTGTLLTSFPALVSCSLVPEYESVRPYF